MSHIHDDGDCGHTDEEHEAHFEGIEEDLTRGYMGPLFQVMPMQLLQENLHGIISEIFVRSKDDVEFAQFLADTVKLMGDVLVRGTEEPEIRKHLLESRAVLREQLARAEDSPEAFMADASEELKGMLEKYGVQEEKGRDDDLPGFYL